MSFSLLRLGSWEAELEAQQAAKDINMRRWDALQDGFAWTRVKIYMDVVFYLDVDDQPRDEYLWYLEHGNMDGFTE